MAKPITVPNARAMKSIAPSREQRTRLLSAMAEAAAWRRYAKALEDKIELLDSLQANLMSMLANYECSASGSGADASA